MKELKEVDLYSALKENVSDRLELKGTVNRDKIEGFLDHFMEKKAVLGFDIYKYSQFENMKQALIPPLLKKLYEVTLQSCIDNEDFFFEYKSVADFENMLVETGDGGFQIFTTPFEALLFAIYFQANVVRYNSGNKLFVDFYSLIGEINLRFSMTYGELYHYKKNYYGPAIINCSRIIARDKLNRFLIDKNSILWFNSEINSLETCISFDPLKDFPTIPIFRSRFNAQTYKSILFSKKGNKMRCLDILKIGEITSKMNKLSIYSLHIQVLFNSGGKTFRKYHVTIGNLNSSGLEG